MRRLLELDQRLIRHCIKVHGLGITDLQGDARAEVEATATKFVRAWVEANCKSVGKDRWAYAMLDDDGAETVVIVFDRPSASVLPEAIVAVLGRYV